MLKFVVLLAFAFLAAEASTGCERLSQCENMIEEEGFMTGDSGLTSYINEDQVMDAVCRELEPFNRCVSSHLAGCSDDTVKNEMKAVKDIVAYMCSAEGRPVVMSLSNSECATNDLTEVRMENVMQGCLETFQFDVQMEALNMAFSGKEPQMSDFCPFIDRLETCLVSGSTNLCGSEMGSFIQNVWSIAARDQFAEFGCVATASRRRRFIKRALPMLMKKTKLIQKLRK